MSAGVFLQILLQISFQLYLVTGHNVADLLVVPGAEDLNEHPVLCPGSLHRFPETPSIVVGGRLEQGDDDLLHVPSELGLQVFDQILAIQGLECQLNLLSLVVGTVGDYVNDRLLVGPSPLHGLPQDFRITLGVEVTNRLDSALRPPSKGQASDIGH